MHASLFLLSSAAVCGLIPLAALGIGGHFLRKADRKAAQSPPMPMRWTRYPTICVRRSLAGLTRLLEEWKVCSGRQAIVATDCLDAFSHWAVAGPVLGLAASGLLGPMPWHVAAPSGVACLLIGLAVGKDARKTMRVRLAAHALRHRRAARRQAS